MRAGGETGHPDPTDQLAGVHHLAFPEHLFLQVAIGVLVTTRHNHNTHTAGAVVDGFNNPAGPPVQNRGSEGSRDVEPGMGTPTTVCPSPLTEVAGVSLKFRNGEHPMAPTVRMDRSSKGKSDRQKREENPLRGDPAREAGHSH